VSSVVSGLTAEYTPVLRKKEIKETDVTQDDIRTNRIMKQNSTVFRLEDTEEVVPINAGIVRAYSINHAIDVIKKNPIGPKISENFTEWPAPPK